MQTHYSISIIFMSYLTQDENPKFTFELGHPNRNLQKIDPMGLFSLKLLKVLLIILP